MDFPQTRGEPSSRLLTLSFTVLSLVMGCVPPSGLHQTGTAVPFGQAELAFYGGAGQAPSTAEPTVPLEAAVRLGLPVGFELGVRAGGLKNGISQDAYDWRMSGGLDLRYQIPIEWPSLAASVSGIYLYLPNTGGGGYIGSGLQLSFPFKMVEPYLGVDGGIYGRNEQSADLTKISDSYTYLHIPLGISFDLKVVRLVAEWSLGWTSLDYREEAVDQDPYVVERTGWQSVYMIGLVVPLDLQRVDDENLDIEVGGPRESQGLTRW